MITRKEFENLPFKIIEDRKYPLVEPYKVDETHCFIICPYCNEKHKHGSRGGKDYEGHRLAHCSKSEPPIYASKKRVNEYFIKVKELEDRNYNWGYFIINKKN